MTSGAPSQQVAHVPDFLTWLGFGAADGDVYAG